ncbi:cutinase [Microdochium nivale]|nr:cutinase [Microdochium nivale]
MSKACPTLQAEEIYKASPASARKLRGFCLAVCSQLNRSSHLLSKRPDILLILSFDSPLPVSGQYIHHLRHRYHESLFTHQPNSANMKTFFSILAAAAAVVVASPVGIDTRQLGGTRITANEFTSGGCRDVIFLFARGSTEVGNMGTVVGPPTSDGLKAALGATSVATEGIDYRALVSTNTLPGGADPAGIREMSDMLVKANKECPTSKIVVTGYSQGAALVHRAVEDQPAAIKDQIVAAVTYGDTQNVQDRGQIPNFPPEKTLVICNRGDLVCSGMLIIAAPHLTYGRRVDEAVQFITQKVNAAA